MNLLDETLRRIERILLLGPAAPTPDRAPVPAQPGRHQRRRTARSAVVIATTVAFPVAFGIALIPFRDHIAQSVSLLMVLPVLVIALLAGRRLGMLAALAAAVAFDVFHTQPYNRLTIDDPDDVIETIVLLAIGVTIGYLAESAQRAVVAARVRRAELDAVTDFLEHIGTEISAEELAQHASTSIVRLLDARECVWHPRYHGTASPVLRPDGTLASNLSRPATGGGVLPPTVEIPVGRPPLEHGRFLVRTGGRAVVSLEERRAAAIIAATLGRCIGP